MSLMMKIVPMIKYYIYMEYGIRQIIHREEEKIARTS